MKQGLDFVRSAGSVFLAVNAPAFTPLQLSAVAAWLRLGGGTVSGSGYSSVPDMLASNPATQSTDARRPVNGTTSNGLPIATFTDDYLDWPLASNNNQSPAFGVGLWVRCTPDSSPRRIFSVMSGGGASAHRIELNQDTNAARGLHTDVYINNASARRGASQVSVTAATWSFITLEYDGAQATDATKCIITIGGVAQTLTFSDSTAAPGAMPATLVQPTGSIFIGVRDTVPNQPFVGDIGPNIYIFNRQLTAGERTALINFERPT